MMSERCLVLVGALKEKRPGVDIDGAALQLRNLFESNGVCDVATGQLRQEAVDTHRGKAQMNERICLWPKGPTGRGQRWLVLEECRYGICTIGRER